MATRASGTILFTAGFLAAGLAGFFACWTAWPRNPGTSPLMALLALLWGIVYTVTAVLTWRRSRLAALSFTAAVGLLLLPARFLVPGGELVVPAAVVLTLVLALGLRYLRGLRPTEY